VNDSATRERSLRGERLSGVEPGALAELRDAAARWRAPHPVAAGAAPADAGNVIVLRRRPLAVAEPTPEIAVSAATRPAPWFWESPRLARWSALVALSATVHLALYLPFHEQPAPLASIGEVAISVEVVLGANQHAGLTPEQGSAEASAPAPAQAPDAVPNEAPAPAPAEVARTSPPEVAQAAPAAQPEPMREAPAQQPLVAAEAVQTSPAVTTPVTPTAEPPPVRATAPETAVAEAIAPAPAQPATVTAAEAPASPVVAAAPAAESPALRPVAPVTPPAEETPPTPAPMQASPHAETIAMAELQVGPNPPPAESTVASAVIATETARPAETQTATAVDASTPTAVTDVVLPTQSTIPPTRPEPRQARPAPPRPERTQATRERRPAPRVAARGERNRSETTSPAARAAGGVGRGRPDADSNYHGRVAAHLARHKRFPPEARNSNSQGSAVVTFSISGSGGVTSVRLARGSGVAALDQEATAMVRRASPFPAPPGGRGMSFSVPVSFRLN
jgi:periplasmic protein TonB